MSVSNVSMKGPHISCNIQHLKNYINCTEKNLPRTVCAGDVYEYNLVKCHILMSISS